MGGLNLDPEPDPAEAAAPAVPAPALDPRALRRRLDGGELSAADLHARVSSHTAGRLPSLLPAGRLPRAPLVVLSAKVPEYVRDQLTQRAARDKITQTFLILTALRSIGIEVKDEDLVEDGRSRARR